MPRNCVNKADRFCYICGKITFTSQKCSITALVEKVCRLHFGCKIGDKDKSWAPHICCNTVLQTFGNGVAGRENICPSLYRWFGESPRTQPQLQLLHDPNSWKRLVKEEEAENLIS